MTNSCSARTCHISTVQGLPMGGEMSDEAHGRSPACHRVAGSRPPRGSARAARVIAPCSPAWGTGGREVGSERESGTVPGAVSSDKWVPVRALVGTS